MQTVALFDRSSSDAAFVFRSAVICSEACRRSRSRSRSRSARSGPVGGLAAGFGAGSAAVVVPTLGAGNASGLTVAINSPSGAKTSSFCSVANRTANLRGLPSILVSPSSTRVAVR